MECTFCKKKSRRKSPSAFWLCDMHCVSQFIDTLNPDGQSVFWHMALTNGWSDRHSIRMLRQALGTIYCAETSRQNPLSVFEDGHPLSVAGKLGLTVSGIERKFRSLDVTLEGLIKWKGVDRVFSVMRNSAENEGAASRPRRRSPVRPDARVGT